MLLSGWTLWLGGILLVIGALVPLGLLLVGSNALSAGARAVGLRLGAGLTATYAAIDVGDLIDDFTDWEGLDIVLTIVIAVGAAILLVAAWRLTGGNLVRDAAGLARISGRPAPDQLVLLGGLAVIVGWVLIRIGNATFSDNSALAVLATVLAMAVAWMARDGGPVQLPVPAGIVIAVLVALVAVLAASWVINILDDVSGADVFFWPGFVLYILGAGGMAAGAALGLQARRPAATA
jgi:hypothetical protein